MVLKQDLKEQGLLTESEEDESEDELCYDISQSKGHAWMPVCTDPKNEDYDP